MKALKYIRFDERGRPEPKIKPYLNPAIEKNFKKFERILKREIAKIYAIKGEKKKMSTLRDRIKDKIQECNRVGKYGTQDFNAVEALDKIMPEIDKENKLLSPPLHWFAELMEKDLRKNDFKGGWLDGELDYYRAKALKHMVGLKDIDSLKYNSLISKKRAIEHCFKSANYCMMLAHNLIEELRKNIDESAKRGVKNGKNST